MADGHAISLGCLLSVSKETCQCNKCLIFWRAGQNKTANTYVIEISI